MAALQSESEVTRSTAILVAARKPQRWAKGTTAIIADLAQHDPSPVVRAAGTTALVQRARPPRAVAIWLRAANDPDHIVRRRTVGLATTIFRRAPDASIRIIAALLHATDDADDLTAESACFGLGEVAGDTPAQSQCVEHLSVVATSHTEPLVREAAVAALGAIGDDAGRAVVLAACNDKPAIRRRAVLALAAFDGPDVDLALERALTDTDWQVRQAAEDLTSDLR